MKKGTMQVEPDEMPVRPPAPEINQPSDPKEPQIPEEDPGNIPQELPPEPAKPSETPPPGE
jgi:hypothetical protein